MRKITLASIVLGAIGVFVLPPSPTQAFGPNIVTWVSGAGSDTNDCASISTPCRSLFAALSKTASGGVMQVLPGYYASVPISQAVDIIADQGGAEIVGAGSAGSVPASLYFAPTTAASGGVPTELTVRNSIIANNSIGNILIKPTNGVAVAALIESTLMAKGLFGIRADDTAGSGMIRVDVRNSVAKGNINNGFLAVGTGANPIHFMIDHSTAENNGVYGAIATGAQAFMIVGSSTLMGNGTGLAQASGATVASYGNNGINFNTTPTSGTITVPLALK